MNKELIAPQLNASAVSAASLTTGMATILEIVPPVAGSISSLVGVCLAFYLLKHRRAQMRIDAIREEQARIDVEISKRTLAKMKTEDKK